MKFNCKKWSSIVKKWSSTAIELHFFLVHLPYLSMCRNWIVFWCRKKSSFTAPLWQWIWSDLIRKYYVFKGFKFISLENRKRTQKPTVWLPRRTSLKQWRKLDFKKWAERQYQQELDAHNLCWMNRFFTCWLRILNYKF